MSFSLIDALDDPVLFAPHFRGDTWTSWRVFLKALFALPMDSVEQEIYQADTGRADLPTRSYSEAALVVGRRGGKSRIVGRSCRHCVG